jgi:DNA end-binding protein Ku
VGLKPGELKMAAQLIADMTAPWSPQNYTDKFSVAIRTLVDKKVAAGDTEAVSVVESDSADAPASNVLDLTELLAKSLAKRGPDAGAKPGGSPPRGSDVTPRSPRKGATKPSARKRA